MLTKRPFYVHNGLRKFNYKVHSSPPTFLHWRCFRVPEWKPMVQRSDVRIVPVVFTLWAHLSQAFGSCDTFQSTFWLISQIIIDTAVAATVTAGHHTAYIHPNLIRAHCGTGGVNGESGKDGKERKERSIF